MKDALGDRFDKMVVKQVSYEVTDATIDSQAVTLQASGADVLLTAATPKFAAQMIRKVSDLGWKPLHFMTNVSISVASVMVPAGAERGIGIISANYFKDNADPTWKDDADENEFRAFLTKYMPGADQNNGNYSTSYGVGQTTEQMLKQCNGDFSRENIMKQAANLHDIHIAVLLPGIRVNTSPTNYHPIRQEQLAKWNGKNWELFGQLIEGAQI